MQNAHCWYCANRYYASDYECKLQTDRQLTIRIAGIYELEVAQEQYKVQEYIAEKEYISRERIYKQRTLLLIVMCTGRAGHKFGADRPFAGDWAKNDVKISKRETS